MKAKLLIFVGIILLVAGIFFRIFSDYHMLPWVLIISGIASKLTYVIIAYINKRYKPGKELLVLYTGLLIFFTGLYFRNHAIHYAVLLMTTGIVMKLTFVMMFILKMRKTKVA